MPSIKISNEVDVSLTSDELAILVSCIEYLLSEEIIQLRDARVIWKVSTLRSIYTRLRQTK